MILRKFIIYRDSEIHDYSKKISHKKHSVYKDYKLNARDYQIIKEEHSTLFEVRYIKIRIEKIYSNIGI